jgi:CheY-like chemotaxis protein
MARKILLADDDEAVREGLDRLLRFEGLATAPEVRSVEVASLDRVVVAFRTCGAAGVPG